MSLQPCGYLSTQSSKSWIINIAPKMCKAGSSCNIFITVTFDWAAMGHESCTARCNSLITKNVTHIIRRGSGIGMLCRISKSYMPPKAKETKTLSGHKCTQRSESSDISDSVNQECRNCPPSHLSQWYLTILKLRNDSPIKASYFSIDMSVIYKSVKYSPKQVQFSAAHDQAQLCKNSLTTDSWM